MLPIFKNVNERKPFHIAEKFLGINQESFLDSEEAGNIIFRPNI